MEIVNNKTGKPIEYYQQEFAAKDPGEMSQRSGVPFDGKGFALNFLNRPVSVLWPSMDAVYTDDGSKLGDYPKILVSRLIMEGCQSPAKGNMLAYTDMPWGNVYAQQFRGRCILRLAAAYGHNTAAFAAACEKLGGKKTVSGDYSYDMEIFKGLTMRLILWEGDDEFPASAQILFSDNFSAAFTAEDMAVCGDVLLNALKGRW